MNSDSADVIRKLKTEQTVLHLKEGVDWKSIPNDDSNNGYVQYCSVCDEVHFEILRYFQQLYVAFHDERAEDCDEKKVLHAKIKCIAKSHKDILQVRNSSETIHKVYVDSRDDFEAVVRRLEDVMCDMYELLGPVVLACGSDLEGTNVSRCQDNVVPRECMKLFLRKDNFPKVGDYVFSPSKDSCIDSIKYCLRFGGEVYYRLRRCCGGILVELCDERYLKEPDVLVSNIHWIAKSKNFKIQGVFGMKRVVSSNCIPCGRNFEEVKKDVGVVFAQMLSAFDTILDGAEKNIESLCFHTISVEKMGELAEPEVVAGARRLADLSQDTFSWVTTIDNLFDKKIIELEDAEHTQIISGQYVIPDYQRKYAWSAENVRALCRDLLRSFEENSKKLYHLGTIILHVEKARNVFYVVDGQQRLRTISRLLSREFFLEGTSEKRYFSQFNAKDEKTILDVLREYSEEQQRTILEKLKSSTVVCIAVSNISESFQLFSTQNGRGKELSPENLLKAFHFHELEICEGKPQTEEAISRLNGLDAKWEDANICETQNDGCLLSELFGEHLYRIRCWVRGVFPKERFSSRSIGYFKGVTIKKDGKGNVPLQNLSLLRRAVENDIRFSGNVKVQRRSSDDGMNPFVTIDQTIVNGADFFDYASAYSNAYMRLFDRVVRSPDGLEDFRSFYGQYCLYARSGRRGDQYARHIFQSLCLICYDRFGEKGLTIDLLKELYRCAYFERATKSRCYYGSCGERFAILVVRILFESSDLSRLREGLHELGRQARNEYFSVSRANMPVGLDAMKSVYEM